MTFTVVWKPDAEGELADVWMVARNRGDVALAAAEIDARLGDDPLNEGESRDGAARMFFVGPLGVTYEVSPDDRLVSVLHVWLVPR